MKLIGLLLVLTFNVFAAENIIKSKEDIIFHTPDKFKFSDIGKISEFKGIIERIYFTSPDMKLIDLYFFKTDALKVDKDLCSDYIEKIFALKKSKLYQLKTFDIADSNKGKVCVAHIADKIITKKTVDIYHRLVYIGFVNTKATVLVFHPKKVNDDTVAEASKFWSSLR